MNLRPLRATKDLVDFRPLLLQGLKIATAGMARSFNQKLIHSGEAQLDVLQTICNSLAKTHYGARFGNIRNEEEFRQQVPIVTWQDLNPWVDQISTGERDLLFPGKALFFERTSGSTSTQKLIPYTSELKHSFQKMFLLWTHDILKHGPKLRTGKIYMSVSPDFRDETRLNATSGGIKIGMNSDQDYLGGLTRRVSEKFIVPTQKLKLASHETFLDELAHCLRAERDLEVLSFWSPTLLLAVLERLGDRPENLWPELKLVSAWGSGWAEPAFQELSQAFSGSTASLQKKGLLLTEAPLTFPSFEAQGFVPLIDEIYFEFENCEGEVLTLHELKVGETYSVLFSQKAGLVRYRCGDQVRVSHLHYNTPCLEFVGRGSNTVDLVGEKLDEAKLQKTLREISSSKESVNTQVFFVPYRAHGSPRASYTLMIHPEFSPDSTQLQLFLEEKLSENYHYQIARRQGQLDPARVVTVADPRARLREAWIQCGGKLGDLKDSSVVTRADVAEKLLLL